MVLAVGFMAGDDEAFVAVVVRQADVRDQATVTARDVQTDHPPQPLF